MGCDPLSIFPEDQTVLTGAPAGLTRVPVGVVPGGPVCPGPGTL